tara:strand:- start:74 stop:295 length:222 start_codon:yes stop_codon:yes gene_type:complete
VVVLVVLVGLVRDIIKITPPDLLVRRAALMPVLVAPVEQVAPMEMQVAPVAPELMAMHQTVQPDLLAVRLVRR